jgi:RNA polymerase sigma factor (sigma-70 family)
MPPRPPIPLARRIRVAVLDIDSPAPDAELLGAFVRDRDPAAFEALVRRHAPLVTAACRAILPNPADADDACQGTFIVLYRKAHTVRDGGALAAWLFRVARRAAREVKKSAARRRACEGRASRSETVPAADLSWREACAILHQEIDALPARYRLPLIACYLEGKTQDKAARALGWSAEVVRGRLDRGREKLRQRLRRRGVALSAALLASAATSPAPAVGVPSVLTPTPAVAAAVEALTATGRGWSIAGAIALAAGLITGGVLLRAGGADRPGTPPAPPKEPVAERPAPRLDAFGDPLPDGAIARLGTVRLNHGDGLKAILHSPDGKTIVSVGNGRTGVWATDTGAVVREFSISKASWDDHAVLKPDGKTLVLFQQADPADSLRAYDILTGKEIRHTPLPIRRYEFSVNRRNALSPDGRLAAANTPKALRVFDTESGKELSQLPKLATDIRDVAFAGPDQLVTADTARTIDVWEARTGKLLRSFDHGDPVEVIVASLDGKLLASLEHHNHAIDRFLDKDRVHVWDLATGKRVQSMEARPKSWFMGAAFTTDGGSLLTVTAAQDGGTTTRWDSRTGKRLWERTENMGQILTSSPDQKRVAVGSQGGRFALLDFGTGKLAIDNSLPVRAPAVHLSNTGERVVVVGYSSIGTWDGTTGRRLDSFNVPYHGSVGPWRTVSPNGRYAMTVSSVDERTFAQVWDVTARRELHKVPVGGQYFQGTFAFSPDSARFVIRRTGEPAKITISDVRSGKELVTILDPRTKWPGTMSFTADGGTLIVAGHRVVKYAVADGKEISSYRVEPVPDPSPGPRIAPAGGGGAEEDRLAWRVFAASPDGSLGACILSGGFGVPPLADRLLLCDGRTGKVLRRWSDSGKSGRSYKQVAFSDDARLLATSDGNEVHLWEAATGREVRTFRGHRNEIEGLALSGNGRRMASSSWDGTVLIWDLFATGTAAPETCWADMLSDDAAKAYAAVWRLADSADDIALPLLRKHLRPVAEADQEKTRKAVAELDSDQFRVRDKAFKELSDHGHHAGPALRTALDKKPSLEARNRIELLLAKILGPPSSGEPLRTSRALASLEAKGNAGAKELLRELAEGASDAWLTQEAKRALRRIDQQAAN